MAQQEKWETLNTDTASFMFWLNYRRANELRDKQDLDHDGTIRVIVKRQSR